MTGINNTMLPNGKTRCWDRHGIYEIDTQPEAIRPPMKCQLYKVERGKTETRRESSGATAGFRVGE